MPSSLENSAAALKPTVSLIPDEIDDLLYIARANDYEALSPTLDALSTRYSASKHAVLSAAIDPESGNTVLHYAGANGHDDLFNTLLSLIPPATDSDLSLLNARNKAGNTPLHWAALNGHVTIVRILLKHGANATILNEAGHDAVYEAEMREKGDVVEVLLLEGKGLDSGVGKVGVDGEGSEQAENQEKKEASPLDGVRDNFEALGVDER